MNEKDKKYIESLAGTGQYNLPDYDKDGVPDILDCSPFDPNKDGFFGDVFRSVFSRARRAATRTRAATRRVSAPAAARARRSAARAMARVRSSVAAAQRRVVAHRRAGVERAAETRRVARRGFVPRVDIVKEYKKFERGVSKRIPTLHDIAMAGAEFGERPDVRRAYQRVGERVLRLPEPIKAVGVETFKFTRGAYKEFQRYPVTTAVKTAAFAAAGPAIGAAGRVAIAGRAAIAARAPVVARIPGVGPAAVTAAQRAAWVGEKAAKVALPAMGALWAGSVGQRVYMTPAERRAEEAGRIFAGEVVPMAAGAAALPFARAVRPRMLTAKDFPEPGVERIAKQLYIGGKRMPVGYEKIVSQQLAPSAGKTQLAMESEYKAMIGQLKYTHTRFARGQIEGEYFLPKPPTPLQIGKPPTVEPGVERLMLPSPAPKPTRLYGEVSQRYIRAREIELAGERPMRWIEAGKRKLEYGVPTPPKYGLPDIGAPPGTWGISGRVQIPRYGRFHPSYPAGITAAEAETLSSLAGVPRPKMIPERMYFQETPITSRYYEPTELLAAMRRPHIPAAAEPTIPVPKPTPKPRVTKPSIEPMMERAPAPEPMRRHVEFAEPTAPYETPWAEPTMRRAPLVEAKRAPLPYAEPTPTKFEFPWAEPRARVAPKPKPAVKPAPKPKMVPMTWRVPTPFTALYKFPEPLVEPMRPPTPTPRRRAYPLPSIYPYPYPAPTPTPTPRRRAYPLPSIYPYPAPTPTPTPTPEPPPTVPPRYPKPTPVPKPSPMPRPAVIPPVPPIPPRLPVWMMGDDGAEERRAPRRRGEREWKQRHELLTLEDFLGYKP